MRRLVAKKYVALLLTILIGRGYMSAEDTVTAEESITTEESLTAEEVLTAEDTHALDSIALSQANAEIEGLKREIENLKVKADIQERKYTDLQQVLQIVMPFAESSITSQSVENNTDFEHIDINALKAQSKTLERLKPYSKKIETQANNLTLLLKLKIEYAECTDFDTKRYSDNLATSIENKLIDLNNRGENILNQLQKNQIDSLYMIVDNYRAAVETFDNLIKNVDEEIGQFRDDPKGDNICKIEFSNIINSKEDDISTIKSYRYLKGLYDRYEAELAKSPRSLTKEIRDEVATMLGRTPTTDTEVNAPDNATE